MAYVTSGMIGVALTKKTAGTMEITWRSLEASLIAEGIRSLLSPPKE